MNLESLTLGPLLPMAEIPFLQAEQLAGIMRMFTVTMVGGE